jgi:hypothetical protein
MADDGLAGLRRIIVVSDGRVKAEFDDGTLLLLNGAGSAFIHVSPAGARSRQLSEYVLSRFAAQVCGVLDFRNLHLEAPFYCKALLAAQAGGAFTTGYPISSVLWPASLAEAEAKGLLQELDGGQVAVQSADATARIVMDGHAQRFAVCYPLLVETAPGAGSHTFLWHTQSFTSAACPERWRPAAVVAAAAVRLVRTRVAAAAATAAAAAAGDGGAYGDGAAHAHAGASGWTADGGADGGEPLDPDAPLFSSLPERTTALPVATSRLHDAVCEGFEEGSWWFEATCLLPPDAIVAIEWAPDATYHFHQPSGDVQARGGSCVPLFS